MIKGRFKKQNKKKTIPYLKNFALSRHFEITQFTICAKDVKIFNNHISITISFEGPVLRSSFWGAEILRKNLLKKKNNG